MTRARFDAATAGPAWLLACLMACGIGGCGKDSENTPNAGAGAGRGPAQAPAGVPQPPPKPQGPLQSELGTRMARFELIPSGRFMVTVLAKNRQDAEAIEANELEGNVMSEGNMEAVKLVAKPSEAEQKEGRCSSFVGYSGIVAAGKEADLVVTLPSGEPKNAVFKIPAGYRSY